VVLLVSYAGFWKRVLATILDVFIFSIPLVVLLGLLFGFAPEPGSTDSILSNLFSFLAAFVYKVGMESSTKQATIGKLIMGIKVTDVDGHRISVLRATGRYFATILSAIILLIGYIMAAFTAKKQCLHDKIASTLVVSK
jgi:uncharacterized RDD family membrane protein YckC